MSSLRILMCSHDSRGLGHTSRTLAIASKLAENIPDCSILVLTDLPIIGRFKFPQNIDYVRLPGIVDRTIESSRTDALNIGVESTLKIRGKIIKSVTKTFRPQLVIVERDPCQLPEEMRRALAFVRQELPDTRIVWGLPDVVGEPEAVLHDWGRHGIFDLFERLCDEVWIHGDPQIFDQAREYEFPRSITDKTIYTGYLRSQHDYSRRVLRELAQSPQRPAILITTGGGAQGYPLINNYMQFLERMNGHLPFQSVIVTGPMMRKEHKAELIERSRRLPHVIFHRFSKHITEYLRHARLVVFTGGYNTHCANLTYQKKAIVSPDPSPLNEHLLRARVFDPLGVVHLLRPVELNPNRLGEMVMESVSNGSGFPNHSVTQRIPMDGLDRIGERIRFLAGSQESVGRTGS